MEKAIFIIKQEIKDIQKNIRHIELQEEIAFDGLHQDDKKTMGKGEVKSFNKTTIEIKTVALLNDLDDQKLLLEYAEFELKRINRLKEQFAEYNMNLKKKYQTMM